MLIVSMIHEFGHATLFRFPTGLMDLPPTRLDACEKTPYFIGQLPTVPHFICGQIAWLGGCGNPAEFNQHPSERETSKGLS